MPTYKYLRFSSCNLEFPCLVHDIKISSIEIQNIENIGVILENLQMFCIYMPSNELFQVLSHHLDVKFYACMTQYR